MTRGGERNGDGEPVLSAEDALRRQIFDVIGESKTSAEQDVKVLLQCASHIRNRLLVEEIAKACKMKLSGFQCSDVLELYYDVKRGGQDMGYISKGWEDPGFRLSNLIEIPKGKATRFKALAPQVRKLCAVNGIAMTVERSKGAIEILMDGVIYSEGFNKKTFKQTIETLNEVVQEAREMIG